MSRKKTPHQQDRDADQPREPISLRRIEVRTEMVALTPEEKVERLEVCNGIRNHIRDLEGDLAELADQVKETKTNIEAAYSNLLQSVGEAHDGHKGSDYDVIVERHPDHPAEMVVWRAPDGAIVADLIAEDVRMDDTLIAMRERQGCSIVEVRAMTGEEMDAAEAEDHKARHPELPIDGLDAPVVVESVGGVVAEDLPACDPETGVAEPAGTRMADLDDDAWESDAPPTPISEGKKGKRGRKVA